MVVCYLFWRFAFLSQITSVNLVFYCFQAEELAPSYEITEQGSRHAADDSSLSPKSETASPTNSPLLPPVQKVRLEDGCLYFKIPGSSYPSNPTTHNALPQAENSRMSCGVSARRRLDIKEGGPLDNL
ncbi:hypothetical protein B0T25DRAFT_303758 [Lasiosphaeria hispida]|uniref:Uncharacterized protein n=1 Tax=Lasiosphaeria hispida TaxID=260671 RepID=A0AAJ0H8X0_9PEZI|nr:hypothetical protein B0T25DRAFT_303758 [Lasiosphaeria hispida]